MEAGAVNLDSSFVRFGSEKYAKFAYSARYGFSVEPDPWRFDNAVLDSMIGLSDDGVHFRVREDNEAAFVAGGVLFAVWRPFPDVAIETWLYWDGDYHVRVHRIDTPRPLATTEGGFAISRDGGERCEAGDGVAIVATASDLAGVFDLGSSVARSGRCQIAAPNTSVVSPKTIVPQLVGELPAGRSTLAVAVFARPAEPGQALPRRPAAPDVAALERLVATRGVRVTLMRGQANRRPTLPKDPP